MKKYFLLIFLVIGGVGFKLFDAPSNANAVTTSTSPQLIITQVKITSSNGQFISLYNNTNSAIDLSTIQLQYFNNYDLLKATSGKLISLTGKVPAHGFVVVDDGPIQACYQMMVNSVSLGLSSTAGFIQVSHFVGTTSPQVASILDDYIGWSKTAATGAQTLPTNTNAFLQRKAPDASLNYSLISIAGTGSWGSVSQLDGTLPCDASAAGSIANGGNFLSGGSTPVPYSKVAGASTSTDLKVVIPDADSGLAAPQISEVLPNPASPQTDANDEFIELYNPNDKAFDLSGFILQAGITTLHKYTFLPGTTIDSHGFTAFYSSDTGLSLSNSDGQVKFLDPAGNLLVKTDEYGTAKDGYAWVSADGLWQWTTKPTPSAVNIIAAPALSIAAAKANAKSKTSVAVKAGKASKTKKTAAAKPSSSSSFLPNATPVTSLHPAILAGVGSLAVLYALYEYRHDLANQFYKLQRHRAARRIAG